jgi:DNA topoisomerase IA
LFHKGYDDPDDYLRDCNEECEEDFDGDEETNLPVFELGEKFPLSQTSGPSSSKLDIVASGSRATLVIKEKMTTAPTYLTESELIGKMEKNQIGTDASISTHIENILKRNYVELLPGRKLKPTKLGLVLAQGYHLIDSSLVLPKVRSDSKSMAAYIFFVPFISTDMFSAFSRRSMFKNCSRIGR